MRISEAAEAGTAGKPVLGRCAPTAEGGACLHLPVSTAEGRPRAPSEFRDLLTRCFSAVPTGKKSRCTPDAEIPSLVSEAFQSFTVDFKNNPFPT